MDKPLRHQQSLLEIPHQKAKLPLERAEGPGYRLADQVVVRVDLDMRGRFPPAGFGYFEEDLA
jgi:hypothetical protein